MTQSNNRFFDEIGRLMNDAAGAAQGVKREVDTLWRNQADKFLRDMDLVKREEFEAVKDMARLAREENEALKARIAALEAKLGGEVSFLPSPGGVFRPGRWWTGVRRHRGHFRQLSKEAVGCRSTRCLGWTRDWSL